MPIRAVGSLVLLLALLASVAWWAGFFSAQPVESPNFDTTSGAGAPVVAAPDALKPIFPVPPPPSSRAWTAEERIQGPDQELALSGTCRDVEGKPVPGAQLDLREARWVDGVAMAGAVIAEFISDERGRFHCAGVFRRGNTYQLSAASAACGSWESAVIDPQLQDTLWQDVVFVDVGKARIRAFDPHGGALAGARVVCADRVESESRAVSESVCAPDGRLELTGIPAAGLTVEVSAEGFSTERTRVMPGSDVRVVLHPAAGVSGRVVVRGSATGVQKARLVLRSVEGGRESLHALSDDHGRFRFDGAGEGLLVLSAQSLPLPPRNVRAGDVDVILELDLGPSVQGTLHGPPSLRGARVMLTDSKEAGAAAVLPGSWSPVQSDGSFSLAARGAGPWHVVAEAPGCARIVSEAVMAPGRMDLTLAAGLRIAGRVVDEAGDPVGGAAVLLRRVVVLAARAHGPTPGPLPGAEVLTRTEGDGSFCCVNLAPGTHELVVSHPSFVRSAARGVEISAGGRIPEVVLQRAGELDGVVRLRGGVADDGAVVLATSEQGERQTVSVDSEGRFHLEGLAPGKWQVKLVQQAGVLRASDFLAVDIRAGRRAFLNLDSR